MTMDQIEINLFALNDELQECGFESSDHLEWEDSTGRTVRITPNYEIPGSGGVWCLAVEASHPAGIIAFAMAVRRLLPVNYVSDVPRTVHEVATSRRAGDDSVIYYFSNLVFEQIGL
jgi:hypothetical protein